MQIKSSENQIDSLTMDPKKDITPLQILQCLNKKYSLSYSFFTTKYINQLIYSVGNSLSIQFENHKAYHDDIEYLRRTYRHTGLNGKKEIEDRIRLVSKYYEQNGMVSPQVPMMILTKVNDIFIKRSKRLKRLQQNKQDSKSQKSSSSFGDGSLSFSFDQDFLRDVHLQFSQLMESSSSQLKNGPKFQEGVHDIYENYKDQMELDTLQKINLKENKVQHLICDFEEVDVQSVINFYKGIKKSKNGSIIMSEILEEEQKLSRKNSQKQPPKPQKYKRISELVSQKTKKSSTISKQSVLSNYIQIFGPKSKDQEPKLSFVKQNRYSTHLLADQCVNEYKKIWSKNVYNAQEQIEKRKQELKQNRSKVRQKAQRLLEIIKKDSFISDFR